MYTTALDLLTIKELELLVRETMKLSLFSRAVSCLKAIGTITRLLVKLSAFMTGV